MEGAKIQISIKLLDKLAGAPKKQARQPGKQQQGRGTPAAGGDLPGPPRHSGMLPVLQGGLGGAFALEPELRGALAASRHTGGLLLKAEEREAAALAAAAEQLVAREGAAPTRPVPCGAERAATADCYRRHAAEAWKCTGLVDAYAACAAAAYDSVAV